MLGSSKDLLRNLDIVFGRLQDVLVQESVQNDPDVINLSQSITAFVHKHATLHSIKQTINVNDHLLRVYNTYIEPSSDVRAQTLFLHILIQLVPTILEEPSMLWLRTYLPAALDSAGVDLKFAEEALELVMKLSNSHQDLRASPDDPLEAARRQQALKIMNHILNIYLGKTNLSIAIKKEENSQMQLERQRFMRKNCAIFLFDYGEKHPQDLFSILGAQFRYPPERLDVLLLLSQFLERHKNRMLPTSSSNLIVGLFKSLLFDNNIFIAEAALNCAYMVIPHIALHDPSHLYISDLLLAFVRLTLWGSDAHAPQISGSFLDANSIAWNAAEFDALHQQNYVTRKIGRGPSTINIQHFATILYGLVPHNFCDFCKDPELYLSKFPPRITSLEYLEQLNNSPEKRLTIQNLYGDQLQAFKLHPAFVNFKSPSFTDLKLELINPLSWFTGNKSPAQVSLACYKLNAGLVFDIPFSWLESDIKIGSGPSSYYDESNLSTRKNSSAGFLSMTVKEGLAQQIVLENNLRRKESSVDFKETSFEAKIGDQPEKHEAKSYLEELYNTHKSMYAPKDVAPLPLQNLNASATTSTETATVHTASTLKPETTESKERSSSNDEFGGRDFYHRELSILANELEFSNYMRTVTTMQFVETKLKLNKLQQEYARDQTIAQDNLKDITSIEKDTASLKTTLNTDSLLTQLETLGREKAELEEKLSELESKHHFLQVNMDERFNNIVPQREAEIADLRRRLEEQLHLDTIKSKLVDLELSAQEEVANDVTGTEQEKRIFDLQTENELLNVNNRQLASQVNELQQEFDSQIKGYEAQLFASKQALSENVGKYSLQYEKKIQELSAVILRYEGLLEERNSRIKQLSSLVPIAIPSTQGTSDRTPIGTYRANDRGGMMDRYNYRRSGGPDFVGEGLEFRGHPISQDRSNSSMESQSSTSHRDYPQKPSSTRYNSSSSMSTQQATPVFKGRGGLQKRSKVKM